MKIGINVCGENKYADISSALCNSENSPKG